MQRRWGRVEGRLTECTGAASGAAGAAKKGKSWRRNMLVIPAAIGKEDRLGEPRHSRRIGCGSKGARTRFGDARLLGAE